MLRKPMCEQLEAQHRNAELTLQRAQSLLQTPAGQQSNVDAALASERSLAAQIAGAQAQLETAQINLGYTEVRAPIDGEISAPKSPKAMSSRRPAAPWRPSSARIRCM